MCGKHEGEEPVRHTEGDGLWGLAVSRELQSGLRELANVDELGRDSGGRAGLYSKVGGVRIRMRRWRENQDVGRNQDLASRQSMEEKQCGLPIKGLGRYQREVCTAIFIRALSTIVKTWNQPKCPSTEEWIKRI